MKAVIYPILFFLLVFPLALHGQRTNGDKFHFAVRFGYTGMLLTDEFISPNEYKGEGVTYGFSWGEWNNNRIVQINFRLSKIKEFKSNLSRATGSSILFDYRHLFYLGNFPVLDRELKLFLGPGISAFFNDRLQLNIPIESQLGFAALNINVRCAIKFTDRIGLNANLLFSALSYGKKSEDNSINTEKSHFEILSFNSLLNSEIAIELEYLLFNGIYIKPVYYFNFTNCSHWKYFKLIGENISIKVDIVF